MIRRFLFRALIPAAALTLTGAIGLTPASAGAATWHIASIVGDPAGQTQLSDVAASGPDNSWITGVGNALTSRPAGPHGSPRARG
jgi:hypothetical protein